MSRWKQSAAAIVSAMLVGSLAWLGQPLAQADDLSDAKAKLSELQGDASEANEQYNQVQAQLDAANAKLEQTKTDIQTQQDKVNGLRAQVAVVTLQQLQDRGISTTTALLTSASQNDALDRIIMSSMVADTTTAILQNYQLGQATLAELQREEQATVDSITADQQKMSQLKDEASQKVTDAQNLVDQLTAAQQAALAQANAAALASAGGSSASYAPPPPVQNGDAAATIVAWAMARVGLPYTYGGAGPNSYDCSGFTMQAFAQVGIHLPHSATSQFNYGVPVSKADLQPGDLVFFYSGPGHVGIYVGGGMIVDARNERVGVVYGPLDIGMPFVGARRLL